ncbi:CST complex subunit Ten1, partial [Aspergillus novoparasiticus]
MNGPPPSTRAFLSSVPSLPAGSKVRFLGCVKTYNIATGHLILEHNYPRCKPTQEPPSIPVDVNAVLGTVTADELRVGAWVNVLGYVRREESSVYVEAVMVFRAGAIAVGEYERILHNSLEVDRRVQRP